MENRVRAALVNLVNELVEGSPSSQAFVLNPGDPGLLRSLEKLSAMAASAVPPQGGASIAAHVDHLRYGFELMNRWSRGEEPFASADFSASWERLTVSDREWEERLRALRQELEGWRTAVQKPRELNDVEFSGIVGGVVHLAYHLGAIRQINRAMRGPAADQKVAS